MIPLHYTLADQGYDVWLGNVHSRKHLNLTTLDPEFWMFSWHQIGVYDLPTIIDRIMEQTK
ncbi:lipase 1-like [Frieseomelitta varia]|uniref:lipase 1-like n=1 Tax=Frieseomelitta varia TaxID=561572 RepID=UPI001CB6AFD0|nr:lipase 1-like [Frieseomelitta varia]